MAPERPAALCGAATASRPALAAQTMAEAFQACQQGDGSLLTQLLRGLDGEAVSLVVARSAYAAFAETLGRAVGEGGMPPSMALEVGEQALQLIQPRIVSFEEQVRCGWVGCGLVRGAVVLTGVGPVSAG